MSGREEIIGDCRLILGDMREVLPTLGKIDAVVTDPPYGIGEDKGKHRKPKNRNSHRPHVKGKWDGLTPNASAFAMMREISNAQIIWGGNYFSDKLPPSKGWLYWQKLMGGNFSDGELAWTSINQALREFTYCNKRGGRVHPAQKPDELMVWCLGFLPSAQTILDPYMGSGTTGIACIRTGRRFIGIEIDEEFFDLACERIRAAYAQSDMFRGAA